MKYRFTNNRKRGKNAFYSNSDIFQTVFSVIVWSRLIAKDYAELITHFVIFLDFLLFCWFTKFVKFNTMDTSN